MEALKQKLALVVLGLAAVLAASCSGEDGGTKAGGSGVPVTLRIGTHDVRGTPGAEQIEEFAQRVQELSDGKVRIKPVFRAAGDTLDWDQHVARLVASGELDMGMIPSRAWDTENVESLRALQAPFLITSDELLAEVVSAELATDMLSGLEQAGVVGLALLPEGLRHPAGFEAPLLGPGDYAGKAIRAPTSNTTAALFAALGATTNDEPADPRGHAGMEASFLLNPGGTVTGNVSYFPKANALVVNDDVFAELDRESREMLEQAATQTREWAIETTPDDAQAAKAFCKRGGVIVLAREAEVAALETAAASVYAELEQDPETKRFIDQIRAMKSELAAPPTPAPCHGSDKRGVEEAGTDEAAGTHRATVIDGMYRAELTEDELRDRGLGPQDAYDNSGLIRLSFERGTLVISEEKDRWADCHGVYTASGSSLSIRITGPGCPYEAEPMTFDWTIEDGALKLVATGRRAADRFIRVWWGSEPWREIE